MQRKLGAGSRTNFSERGQSSGGIASEEERNHVIRVLEHECRVYNFEKNVNASLNFEGAETSYQGIFLNNSGNYVRQGRGGDDFEVRPNPPDMAFAKRPFADF